MQHKFIYQIVLAYSKKTFPRLRKPLRDEGI